MARLGLRGAVRVVGGAAVAVGAASCDLSDEDTSSAEEDTSALENLGFGDWSFMDDAPTPLNNPAEHGFLATHSSLLRNDKILAVAGSSYNCCFTWGRQDSRLVN